MLSYDQQALCPHLEAHYPGYSIQVWPGLYFEFTGVNSALNLVYLLRARAPSLACYITAEFA